MLSARSVRSYLLASRRLAKSARKPVSSRRDDLIFGWHCYVHRTAHTRRHSPNNGATNQVIFPSAMSRYLVSNRLLSLLTICHSGFHPLCRGTWFPTRYKSHVRSACFRFHPLCRGTWFPTTLISVNKKRTKECFHPLCRGTWFPTIKRAIKLANFAVSIRYVAVLGFQRDD